LRAAGRAVSGAQYYDPEAQSKLDAATNSFKDVEFDVIARVVALDEVPVGELSGALETALQSPTREEIVGAGGAEASGGEGEASGEKAKTDAA
jgi:hypothetical protein